MEDRIERRHLSCPHGNVMEERSERGWKKKEFPFLFIFN